MTTSMAANPPRRPSARRAITPAVLVGTTTVTARSGSPPCARRTASGQRVERRCPEGGGGDGDGHESMVRKGCHGDGEPRETLDRANGRLIRAGRDQAARDRAGAPEPGWTGAGRRHAGAVGRDRRRADRVVAARAHRRQRPRAARRARADDPPRRPVPGRPGPGVAPRPLAPAVDELDGRGRHDLHRRLGALRRARSAPARRCSSGPARVDDETLAEVTTPAVAAEIRADRARRRSRAGSCSRRTWPGSAATCWRRRRRTSTSSSTAGRAVDVRDEPDGTQAVWLDGRGRAARRRRRRPRPRPPRRRPSRRRGDDRVRRRQRPRPPPGRPHRRPGPVGAGTGRRRHRARLRAGVHRPRRPRHRGPRRALRDGRRRPRDVPPERRRAGAARRVAARRAVPLEARLPPAGPEGADAEVPRRRRRRAAAGVPAPAAVPARHPAARRQGGRLGLLPRAVQRPRRAHDVRLGRRSPSATARPTTEDELDAVVAATVPDPVDRFSIPALDRPLAGLQLRPPPRRCTTTSAPTSSPTSPGAPTPPTAPTSARSSGCCGRSAPSGASGRPARSPPARGSPSSARGGSRSSCTTPAGRRRPACASCWPSPTSGWSASSAPARRSRPTRSSAASSPAARATTRS